MGRQEDKWFLALITGLLLSLAPFDVTAGKRWRVEQILALKQPPPGVVFEIVQKDPRALAWAIPHVRREIDRLRKRFPALPVAVVTHGREQFALQKRRAGHNSRIQRQARALVDSGVELHVCGTYARWRGLSPEDFPSWVSVATAGPTQIRDYEFLGYLRVVVRRH